jgi:predicted transposase YdaD
MMELSESLFDIVDSVLSWEQAHKEYHIRRRLLDFISSGDRFSLELYRFFLKSSALVMAKRDNKIPEARVLFRIANDLLEAEDLSKWEDFLITHLCSSFANFAGFQKQWEEKRNAPSQPVVSSIVVVPGEEATKKSKWAILEEFLTEMILSGRR